MFQLSFYKGKALEFDPIPLDDQLSVGRSSENDVVLRDTSVSRRHAVFHVDRSSERATVVLEDLGSTNGCELNGAVFRGKQVVVQPTDTIRIGVFRIELHSVAPRQAEGADDERTMFFEAPPISHESLPIDRLRALHELSTTTGDMDFQGLLEATANAVDSCIRHDGLCIFASDEKGRDVIRAWNADGPCSVESILVSRRVLEKCLRENAALLADRRMAGSFRAGAEGEIWKSLSSVVCAPLVSSKGRPGAIYVSSEHPDLIYDRDDLQFLILVAHQLSTTLIHRRVMSDLRTEAKKLEAIVGSLQEGVLVADEGFRILSANSAARRALGEQRLQGKQLTDALAGFQHSFDQHTAGRGHFEIVVPSSSTGVESTVPTVYAATVSQNAGTDQGSWKYVICLHDVTQTQRNERMKALFVNRLAHKLRTPLAVITGVNALIAEQSRDTLEPELRDLLDQSLEYSEECSDLIGRFVEYTSLGLGPDATTTREVWPLDELLAGAELANQNLIAKKRFHIHREFPAGALRVRGKRENMALVVYHIVQNAVKFGEDGGHLTVRAHVDEDFLRVEFVDDGPGIRSEELQNLFQMLHQVDVENTGEVSGAGMGLWITKEIVQAHGGEIRVVSPVGDTGHGTAVEVWLRTPEPDPQETSEEAFDDAFTKTCPLQ